MMYDMALCTLSGACQKRIRDMTLRRFFSLTLFGLETDEMTKLPLLLGLHPEFVSLPGCAVI